MRPIKREFLASYPYHSPRTGRVVFEAVKYRAWYKGKTDPGKIFAYRHQCDSRSKCDRCGGVYFHYGKPGGANGLLYRTPQSNYAFWCEGEKDADTVGAEGTSHHGGAGKANTLQARQLLDVPKLFIAMDLDHEGPTSLHGPGAWCAWRRFLLLQTLGKSAIVVAPREGKDLTDHIELGYSLGSLRRVDLRLLQKAARESNPRRLSRKWRGYASQR